MSVFKLDNIVLHAQSDKYQEGLFRHSIFDKIYFLSETIKFEGQFQKYVGEECCDVKYVSLVAHITFALVRWNNMSLKSRQFLKQTEENCPKNGRLGWLAIQLFFLWLYLHQTLLLSFIKI